MESENDKMTAPFKCPLTSCDESISSKLILAHFLKEHQEGDPVDFTEVMENEKVPLKFSMNREVMELDENVCLGILVYEMNSELQRSSNTMLAQEFQSFEGHAPLFIMACRGNYVKLYDKDSDFIDPAADFLAIWLVTTNPSEKELYVTMTAHSEDCSKSISSLARVRNCSDSQEIRNFIDTEADFLVIPSGFLDKIASDGSLLIEISIAENLF